MLLWLRDVLLGRPATIDSAPSRCKACNYAVEGLFTLPIAAENGILSHEVLARLRGDVRCPECGEPLTLDSTVVAGYVRGAAPDPFVQAGGLSVLVLVGGLLLFFWIGLPLSDSTFGHAREVRTSSTWPLKAGNVTGIAIISNGRARAHEAAKFGSRKVYRFERPGVDARFTITLNDGRKAEMRMPFVPLGEKGWLHAEFVEPDGDSVQTTDAPTQSDVEAWLDRSGITQRTDFADKVLPMTMASLGSLSSSHRVLFSLRGPGLPTGIVLIVWMAPFAWGARVIWRRGQRLSREHSPSI